MKKIIEGNVHFLGSMTRQVMEEILNLRTTSDYRCVIVKPDLKDG